MMSHIEPELLQKLVEKSPDGVVFAGADGMIRVWNAAAERIFGFSAQEALGQSLDLIIPERFRERHWAGYDRALADGETKYKGKVMPTRSMRKDGTAIYIEMGFAIIKDGQGKAIGAVATVRDITERFQREKAQATKG
jgi:PAS domain S-box-containing protein